MVASKIIFIVIAVVVTIMVGVVIAASLGTQDDVPEATDPESIHATSKTSDTVNGTSGTLAEPQDSVSQTTVVGNRNVWHADRTAGQCLSNNGTPNTTSTVRGIGGRSTLWWTRT